MADYFDNRETQDGAERERELCARLPDLIAHAVNNAPSWAEHFNGHNPADIISLDALASLPVLRKPKLMEKQKAQPPFGGFAAASVSEFGRVFMSPGPIWEPQPEGDDAWNGARSLYAAGFRKGDIVHNVLSYHMTPGGFILDQAAVALGCAVFPAGPGNTETQVQAMQALQPIGYLGTPDYLKAILDKADEMGVDLSCIKRALVSGGALFPSMREDYNKRGISVLQAFATADLGCIAYESEAMEGLIVNEDYIVEIVKPGTNQRVPDGDVGEIVVTSFKRNYPLIRFGTGDMSAVLAGQSPCGRTNMRIKGWMGRADQRTKVKGMFIDPSQVADIEKAVSGLGRLRLEVVRDGDRDGMVLKCECAAQDDALRTLVEEAVLSICKMKGTVELVAPDSLPNDGKVIDDLRDYES